MLQIGTYGLGIALIALAILMVFLGRPRQGQVVGFMRGKPNVQTYYSMALLLIGSLGIAFLVIASSE